MFLIRGRILGIRNRLKNEVKEFGIADNKRCGVSDINYEDEEALFLYLMKTVMTTTMFQETGEVGNISMCLVTLMNLPFFLIHPT